jgi:putative transposase/transposase-like zinc-binding protein
MTPKKPLVEVADVARGHGHELIESGKLTGQQKKVMSSIINCRTAKLGGHKEECTNSGCHYERYAYNGCRDRHCPKCNGLKREKWIADRKADALPVPYFHIVFTLPAQLESLCMMHGPEMYNLLFQTVWETICCFSKQHKYLGAQMGIVALLHTWGQNLMRHTHIHCLVPAGGIDAQGKWRMCKQEGKFFVHVKKLSKVFRGKFTDGLIKLQNKGIIELEGGILLADKKYLHPLYQNKWVVYTKQPLPTSDKVVEYIGRYSHRVAISNHRIKKYTDGKVTFSWIDYRTSKPGLMPLNATHFLQRFLSHVLPVGFMKIRHYGILASRNKAGCIKSVREQFNVAPAAHKELNWMETFELLYGRHPKLCPCCKIGIMVAVLVIQPAYRIRMRDGPKLEANVNFRKRQQ